jgi:mono/diheme cytochrome c family protein
MSVIMKAQVGAILAGAAMLAACGPSAPSAGDKIKRGEYLVTLAACSDCHTPGSLLGKPEMDKALSGGNVGFQVPELGVSYPPNLTSDKDTGLGNWTEDEIVKTLRTGTRPDGRQLSPVMPYPGYAKLTDDDAYAIAAYLKSLAPISNKVPGPFGPSETPTAPYQIVVFPGQPIAPVAPPPPAPMGPPGETPIQPTPQ